MLRVLVGLVIGVIVIITQSAPVHADHTNGVRCLAQDSRSLLGFQFELSKDGGWFIRGPGFLYYSPDTDSVWDKHDYLQIKDRKNIFLREDGDTDRLSQKARFDGVVSLDGEDFDLEFKDQDHGRDFRFTSNNDNSICDTF